MAVTPDVVRRIAELAALRLRPEEVDRLTGELTSILEHMETLEEVRRDTAERTGALGSTPTQSDRPGPDRLAQPPQAWAPGWQDGFFTVPRLTFHDMEAEEDGSGGTP